MEDLENKSYEELKREYEKLDSKYNEIWNECLKAKEDWEVFKNKSREIATEIYHVSKYLRLKQSASMTFGRESVGDKMTLEEFINRVNAGMFIDSDGEGYYGTEKGESDVLIMPSDITDKIYRTDFSHVTWYNK